ncbi:MAG TPA: SGNH/GDSL hydrolase family protein [Sphingobium sp.]|uniref:SGNH/GDSL hydrolase family protein n=1 Tax=Sphingobium sp. TaxID=1912891 RepID=UPI002ED5AB00
MADGVAAAAMALALPLGSDAAASSGGVVKSPTALKRWRRALSRMRSAEGYMPLIVQVGDSKTAGVGTEYGTNQFRYASSITPALAKILTSRGAPAIAECAFGSAATGNIPATLYDPRRTGMVGWSLAYGTGSAGGIGGELMLSTNTNPAIFTPSIPVDSCRVLYKQGEGNSATATATVTVDADATVRANLLGGAIPSYTRSPVVSLGSLASHAIKINPAGTLPFYFAGILSWNSTVPAINIANVGVSGVKASYIAANAYLQWLGSLAPDMTIINIGSNDMIVTGPTDITAFTTSVQAVITRAKVSGDAIIVFPAIGRDASSVAPGVLVTDAQRVPFRATLVALAAVNDCVFVDEQALFGGRDVAHADGVFVDDLHESYWATVVRANNLASILLS